jgi:hypothetical protein
MVYAMRFGEYVLPKPAIKPFQEFEKFYIEEVIGSANWKFVRRQDPNSSIKLATTRREKAIHSVGDRPNPRAVANSDPPPKPVLNNDERWLGRWNNYGRSRSAVGQDRTANATLL